MANDNPALLHHFLQDDLYLLKEDQGAYSDLSAKSASMPTEQPVSPIVEAPKAEPVQSVTETPKLNFKYLGSNKKKFLILVNYADAQYMAEAHLKALESTLGRKTLSIDDVAIVNIAAYANYQHQDYLTFFVPEKLLILGASAVPAGLASVKLNAIEQLENRLQLYTHNFDEMLADREKAKAFWEQMKNL
ncbi:hypothetical protein [Mucilaginibacter agri]|uniref:Uncharacterized protein n=1 Tax=Mucilaginibacter agri TaxID=2695265 RepID=A0A966DR80_9SPHI|nr:hypothetical protein [Mucilaginibacter agri]NCD68768.1 hypothetical protein [Mucilaginibacter agri]